MDKSFTTPELDRACEALIQQHSNDAKMTVRVNYFANDTNERWLISQKIPELKNENNPDGLVGVILTRTQVVGMIELFQRELERTTTPTE